MWLEQRIVIVDDDDDVVESLREILRDELPNARIETETNPEDTLQFARRNGSPISLVIADHHMEGKSGLDLLSILHREGLLKRGILISGDPEAGHYLRASGKPFAFLEKPITPETLVASARRELLLA